MLYEFRDGLFAQPKWGIGLGISEGRSSTTLKTCSWRRVFETGDGYSAECGMQFNVSEWGR